MKQKILRQTGIGVILGMALWAGVTLLAGYLRGSGQFPAVSGHLVMVYGSELRAVTAQCICAILCGILWCNGALIFRETDWNLLIQTGVHILACMIPGFAIVWLMYFMPRSLDGLMQYLRLFGALYGANWAVQYLLLQNSVKILNEKLNSDMEETAMKKNTIRRPAVMAALLLLCICVPVAGMAVGNTGFFRDIMRGTAVVGTEYVQATGEIRATAEYAAGQITVNASFLSPDKAPFSEIEELAVGSCRITDASGKTVVAYGGSEAVRITGGQAVLTLPAENLAPGGYILQIESFVGSKKADQPLPMKGTWDCEVTVE